MPTLRSSVLIIAHPRPESVGFGADFAKDFDEAKTALEAYSYPVVALPSTSSRSKEALGLLDFATKASPLSQRVIIQNDTSAENLRHMINSGSVFRILPSFEDAKFEVTIREALEEHSLLQQNSKLLQLVNEQNDRLKRLTTELEERVEARKKSLEEAKEKLLVTNDRVEALHRALVAIHRATSIAEMERMVNEALSGALNLSLTRILFLSQSRMDSVLNSSALAVYSAPLTRGKDVLGTIYFARPVTIPFTRDETGFLGQIAEAVSLAIDRLTKLEQSETMKHQWEATFDAISEPVSLIASDFTVVRLNRAFAERSGSDPEKIIGRKCHEALFGRTTPCEGCAIAERGAKRDLNFRLKPKRTAGGHNVIYDVFSQKIRQQLPFQREDSDLFVNMYHDVSEQLRYERQILDSAKMAELGTIGSSIAHELNNPLGGMLSFLQLIKMELKGGEPWYDDIVEMEAGARRCRDIVQSLLGFTRKSSDAVEIVDLREVLEQALKITELQTRAMGITLVQNLPKDAVEVRGQFNTLAQTLRGFFQSAQEAIGERVKRGDRTPGEIHVKLTGLEAGGEWNVVEIEDNGGDRDETGAIGLSMARELIGQHGGRLETRTNKGRGTTAIISLPRPVFDT
ncbi:MAG: histidine kinase dimerization/phospho-acceptor domain-containing protein [Bdellovibrionota bacterium]